MSEIRRITVRDRGQVTLPAAVVKQLRLSPGDKLDVTLKNGDVVMTPARKRGVNAMEALRKAFAEANISEDEWIVDGKRIRAELVREKYGRRAEA